MSQIDPRELQRCLKGVDYPASRQSLIDTARDADAPDDVLQALEQLADKQYEKPTDVNSALSS